MLRSHTASPHTDQQIQRPSVHRQLCCWRNHDAGPCARHFQTPWFSLAQSHPHGHTLTVSFLQAAQPYSLVGLTYCGINMSRPASYTITYSVTGGTPAVIVSATRTLIVQVSEGRHGCDTSETVANSVGN
jgi:hypothetical protein